MSVERFQILSLDGGGIRGMYTAGVLAGLEGDLGTSLVDHFDMIVGTSTGGIIAIGLGLGIPVKQLLQLYRDKGSEIFPGGRRLRHWLRTKFDSAPLEKALRDAFGERTLGDSRRALAIPYYDLRTSRPSMYKTQHHPDLMRDKDVLAWHAAMGTTAAPTYLPPSRHVAHSRHVDGGVWANNPAMVGVLEAHSFLGVPLDRIRVLSLGTANCVKEWPAKLDTGGKFRWAKAAPELILRAQSDAAEEAVTLLLGKDRHLRVNPIVTESWNSLDKVQVDEFVSRAWSDSRAFGPRVRDAFLDHKAVNLEGARAMGAAQKAVELEQARALGVAQMEGAR
ncbi:MAG: CBASS cGAMP-activated phospholipase [Planctomycetota bacterium]|nr:CBASS cGAMP-activated phospholipase [Planctomycetota bacterium]